MTSNVIEVENLTKQYGNFQAVNDLSFSQANGECLAILGPNGAGKTTTVEILEGFKTPTSGSVNVLGITPKQAGRQWHNQVGVVLQSAFAASSLTVKEEIKLASTSYANPRPVEETIEMVGLTGKERQPSNRLSGGQRRRLDVALGILGHPQILFLDEPTTGFDPSARHDFWHMIKELNQNGTSILLTTHYLDEAEYLADRVLVIADGKLIAEGTQSTLGGKIAHLPQVSWIDPTNGLQHVDTDEPTKVVTELAAHFDGEIPGLQIVKPSLEDIYLQLIDNAGTN